MPALRLRRPTHLILDFDGTLTTKDTMEVLGQLPKEPTMTWQEIANSYMEDYQKFQQASYPWRNYGREEFSNWLASRKWVEARSAQRVQDAGFFRRVTVEDIDEAIDRGLSEGKLLLREKWMDLIELFLPDHDNERQKKSESQVSILSINWSETFIRRALYQVASRSGRPQKDKLCSYINDMKIYANEIEGLAAPEGSSGRVCRPFIETDLRTSRDKFEYFERFEAQPDRDLSISTPFVIYVGDSSTDFDCLCGADLGIWLYDVPEEKYEQTFKAAFQPLDFIPPPITSGTETNKADALFYWAPSFDVVLTTLTDG